MTAERKDISIISTYATDRLIDAKTKSIIREQRGGPVLYIAQALRRVGVEPQIYVGKDMLVEILVEEDEEYGQIHEPEEVLPIPNVDTSAAIVSTLLREWDLTNAHAHNARLFVDIQGYVRDGSSFGKKQHWPAVKDICDHLFCLKGNDVEIAMLPKSVIKEQAEKRMLITTRDSKGVDIYYLGKRYIATPDHVIKPPDTIGAGDTWFANFVAKFTETEDVISSAEFAIDQTSQFLSAKILQD